MAITTIFLTGFEHGFLATGANAGGGLIDILDSVTASTTTPRNGDYCLRAVSTASATKYGVGKNITVATKIVVRFAVRFVARPSAAGVNMIARAWDGTNQVFIISISNVGQITGQMFGGTNRLGPVITDTNWHLFEFQIDTAAKTTDWKVDGDLQPQATTTLSSTGVNLVNLGMYHAGQMVGTHDYDDWIIGTWTNAATDWYGDGKVLGQSPGSDGTHATITSLSPGDAGTAYSGTPTNVYTMVDDPPTTGGWTATRSTTDCIALRTATVGAYAEIKPVATTQGGEANAVRAIMSYSSSGTQANRAACDVRNSAGAVTELWGLTGGVGQAYNIVANQFKGGIVTRPAAGWTAAEVNAVRLRFGGCTSADIAPVPTVQALMLEVDWPPTPGSSTISVSPTSLTFDFDLGA